MKILMLILVLFWCVHGTDIPQGDTERNLRLQHQGASQEHVGIEGTIQTLQARCIEKLGCLSNDSCVYWRFMSFVRSQKLLHHTILPLRMF
jgi:hypothetical protein